MNYPMETIGKLISTGLTETEKGMRLICKFQISDSKLRNLDLPEEIQFVRIIKDKASLKKTVDALEVMGLRSSDLSSINDLTVEEIFDFNQVKCPNGEFRLVLDEVNIESTNTTETRAIFVNNIKGREFNRLSSTGSVKSFLDNLR